MPVYISLVRWTDQGRAKASSLPERVAEVDKRIEALGGRSIGNWLTMGRFDQIAVVEAPDDETAAKMLMVVAERGNAITETLRAFSMEELRNLLALLNRLHEAVTLLPQTTTGGTADEARGLTPVRVAVRSTRRDLDVASIL